jgi:hypothetical protein
MTLDEAITHYTHLGTGSSQLAHEALQLSEWLQELRVRRKQTDSVDGPDALVESTRCLRRLAQQSHDDHLFRKICDYVVQLTCQGHPNKVGVPYTEKWPSPDVMTRLNDVGIYINRRQVGSRTYTEITWDR